MAVELPADIWRSTRMTCSSHERSPSALWDRFDNHHRPIAFDRMHQSSGFENAFEFKQRLRDVVDVDECVPCCYAIERRGSYGEAGSVGLMHRNSALESCSSCIMSGLLYETGIDVECVDVSCIPDPFRNLDSRMSRPASQFTDDLALSNIGRCVKDH